MNKIRMAAGTVKKKESRLVKGEDEGEEEK
jgi:hypothetical protein